MRNFSFKRKAKDFLFGLFLMEPLMAVKKAFFRLELGFMSVVIGDFLGLPLLSPIYKLKLLVYWFPTVENWKTVIMKEYDITDKMRE